LADERLDRRRVVTPLPLGERLELECLRDEALAGAGRRREDHVLPLEELEEGLLLRWIGLEARRVEIRKEPVEERGLVHLGRRGEMTQKERSFGHPLLLSSNARFVARNDVTPACDAAQGSSRTFHSRCS